MPKKRTPEPEPVEEAPIRRRVPRGGVANKLRDTQPDTRTQITVKQRLGKRWSEIITAVKNGDYTWAEFASELTPAELARGQLMDKKGTFLGRPPALVPRAFQQACMAEIHKRFNEKVQERLLDATDELITMSGSGFLEQKDRAKVLIYLIERVMGPVPKTVHVTADEPWQGLLTQGLFRPAEDGTPGTPPPRSDRYAKRRQKLDPEEDNDD
jgi:hypothetical protein